MTLEKSGYIFLQIIWPSSGRSCT